MGLDAGSVYTTLGGKFNGAGFEQYGSAMESARARTVAAEKAMSDAHARSQKNLDALGKTAKVVALGGLVALGGGLAYSIKQAADFERSMRNVNSIAGLTPKQFDNVRESVLKMSRDTAQAPKVLADGLYQIYSSGVKGVGALKVLHASAIAATAGLTDTGTAATAIVGVLDAYHLKATDAAHVSDILFQTVNRGVITFPQLAQTIGTVLPFAAALKIPLNDVGAAISTLTKEGIPAANATTYLKNAMTSLTKPSTDLKKAIHDTGYESGQSLIKAKGFEGALNALIGTTDGSQKALHALFPDIRANAAVLGLTGKNAKSAGDDIKAFSNSAVKGAAAKVFGEQSKGASVQVQQLSANLQHAAIVLGSQFLPYINEGAKALGKLLDSAEKTGTLGDIGDAIKSGLGEAVHVIGDFVHIGGQVVGTIADVVGALTDLAGVDLGDPTQVEAVIAGYLGFKAVETVGPILVSLASGIQKAAAAARDANDIEGFLSLLSSGGAAGPVKAAAIAVGILAAGLVLLGNRESEETILAKQNTAAKQAQADALRDVADAELAAADKGLALRDAQQQLKQARSSEASTLAVQINANKKLNQLQDDGKKGTKEYTAQLKIATAATSAHKDAVNQTHDAYLREQHALKDYGDSVQTQSKANTKAVTEAATRQAQAAKTLAQQQQQAVQQHNSAQGALVGNPQAQAALAALDARNQDRVAKAQDNLTRRVQEYDQALSRSNITQASRRRLMDGESRISDQNAQSISKVQQALEHQNKSAQDSARILGQRQDVLAKAGDLLRAGANQSAVVKVLGDTSDAKNKLKSLQGIENDLPDAKIRIAADNGDALGALKAIQDVKLRDKVVKILGSDDDAKDKVKQLEALGIKPKTAKLLAQDLTSDGVRAANQRINSVKQKQAASIKAKNDTATAASGAQARIDAVKQSSPPGISARNDAGAGATAAQAAIDAVHGRPPIDIVTNHIDNFIVNKIPGVGAAVGKASGRGPGAAQRALVGEGGGPELVADPKTGTAFVVSKPTLLNLPASAYVIPSEDKYKGRAAGLMAMLMHDMGIESYAAGKKPAAKAPAKPAAKQPVLKVPPKYNYPVVDETVLKNNRDAARNAVQKREGSIHDDDGKIHTADGALAKARKATAAAHAATDRAKLALTKAHNLPNSKTKKGKIKDATSKEQAAEKKMHAAEKAQTDAANKLKTLRADKEHLIDGGGNVKSSLKDLKTAYGQLQADYTALHKANQRIERLNTEQDTDRTKMDLASTRHDSKGYLAAQKDRDKVLGELKQTYQTALDLLKKAGQTPDNSNIAATIAGQLAGVQGDQQDNSATYGSTQDAPDTSAPPTYTDAQQALLDAANRKVAEAALTDDTADDITAAGGLVNLLQGFYDQAEASGAPNTVITGIADDLASAKGDLKSLTTPDGTDTGSGASSSDDNTGITTAQQAAIDKAGADIALAALTPDLGDDVAGANELVNTLQGILSVDLTNGTPNSAIADIAGQLKSAQDNLSSLTGGSTTSATNDNPDLQAQLDQANQNLVTARQEAAINAAALTVFQGSGDLGVGIAGSAPAINIFSPSWAMPSPQQAVELAGQTVRGIGLQASITSPRADLGI